MTALAYAIDAEEPTRTIETFTRKIKIGAWLFQHGYLDLIEVVDQIQHYAERTGVIDQIGQNETQSLISAAFGSIAREIDEGAYE